MRWSIRKQIMIPVAVLVLASVLGTSIIQAYLAVRQSESHSFRQLQTILDTLSQSRFPYSVEVLENIKGLSGAEFVAVNKQSANRQQDIKGTVKLSEGVLLELNQAPRVEQIQTLSQLPIAKIDGRNHFVAKVATPFSPEDLYVLYPEGRLREAQWDAVFAPLLVGGVAAGLGVLLSAWLAERLARHIRSVSEQLSLLAQRHFVQIEAASPVEELYDLQSAANRLSQRLAELESEIVRTERLRLLAQLAGGLSHHLRNSVTGARLAIQLHRRRCAKGAEDESLDVAERQLSLTEEQIKGILSLGTRKRMALQGGDLANITAEVQRLMEPIAKHVDVQYVTQFELTPGLGLVEDVDAIRAAIVNLVSNAIEAAGTGGEVVMRTRRVDEQVIVEVEDSGPGPQEDLQNLLFEPFITSKSEGVGLGLFLARQAAEATKGILRWERRADRTVFWLCWKVGGDQTPAKPSSEISPIEPVSSS